MRKSSNLVLSGEAQLIAHIQNTNSQYNLPAFEKKLTYAGNRTAAIAERFEHASVQLSMSANLKLIEHYDEQILTLERHLERSAKVDDPITYAFLRTVPGIGPILALTILYETHTIQRFGEVGQFLSYARLVPGIHESAGKKKGDGGKKQGNAHLKWAFSEAASLMLRSHESAKKWMQRRSAKSGTKKAHAILEAKIGRLVYDLWRTQRAFDAKKFMQS